ncbi:MAG: TonB-dependent receptor plug domain-containing protein [Bacteroidia bacterium]
MRTLILLPLLILGRFLHAQNVTISGYVREAESGEALVGVVVWDSISKKGVQGNDYGFYSLTVPAGIVKLRASFVTYIPYKNDIWVLGDTVINLNLSSKTLAAVQIIGKGEDYSPVPINRLQISLQELEAVPALLGEKDLLKSLALTPGVSVGTEGSSGLLVRGGSPDQNLILLDDATVYNSSHLFGFVSVFNTDAIKKVELYKGAFPARYGGRLSSVLDIKMKEGNLQGKKGLASIGLLSSRVTYEGPLKWHNTSFILSGRASYLGLIGLPIYLAYQAGAADSYFNYWLYDVNAKVNHTFKDKSQIFVSFYNGYDNWLGRDQSSKGNESKFGLNWGNTTNTLRYNRILHPKLFLKGMVLFSNYGYRIHAGEKSTLTEGDSTFILKQSTRISSTVQDIGGKLSLDFFPFSFHTLRTGVEVLSQKFHPGVVTNENNIFTTPDENPNPKFFTRTLAGFAEYEARFFSRIILNMGVRGSVFQPKDTSFYAWEPRLSFNLLLSKDWAFQVAYSKMRQNLHLLSSNGAGLPNDIWVPATKLTGAETAEQYSVGLSASIPDIPLTITLESYYKQFAGLIDYQTGYSLITNYRQNWENLVETQGEGKAYGIEALIHKKEGRISGWISYTWSVNQRKFENINRGEWFAGRFDRRNDFSVTGSYTLNKRWRLSGTWVYSSGSPVTLPVSVQQDNEGQEVLIYGDRNNSRMPAYHRLDLGAELTIIPSLSNSPTWNFSIYNVYNRQNPFFLEIKKDNSSPPDTIKYNLVQRSLFPFLPSISYSWRF